MMEV
jgi:hypothetical protein